jgi:translation initiation factor IF-2
MMTESDGKKVLSLGGTKGKLELKKSIEPGSANAGLVRQSFSHGRSKTVAVEVKRKREGEAAAPVGRAVTAESGKSLNVSRPSGTAPRQLTQEARAVRRWMAAKRGAARCRR